MKRINEEKLNIYDYDPTDDYDESFEGEDDIIEVIDIGSGNNSLMTSIVGSAIITLFCGLIFLLAAKGYLR